MTNPVYKFIAVKTRKRWHENDSKRNAPYKISNYIEVSDNISYGKHGKWNKLAVYRPKNADKNQKLPCIVSIHGGGFFYGTKEVYQFYCADLAERGFVVINFNYRLAPEAKYPKQLEDISNVMLWLKENGEQFGADLEKVFFVGDSAGGNLAYTYTLMATNPELAHMIFSEKSGVNFCALKPKAVGLNCGLYDFYLCPDDSQQLMLKAYIGKNGMKKYKQQLCLGNFLTSDFPPVFVMSAANDFILYQFQPLVDLLKAKGIKTVAKVYGTKEDESAVHVFHVDVDKPLAKQCNDEQTEFFKSLVL